MEKILVSTAAAPAAIGPYAQGNVWGDLVFCSGQIPLDPLTGQIIEGSIANQADQSLKNLAAVLQAGGANLSTVLKTTIFLTDMADFAAVNEVYGRYFPNKYPARSTVEVRALPRGARVEIEAIAHRL